MVAASVEPGSTVYADEASWWDDLHARFATRRINHSVAFMDEDACTNQAESYFSRLRRAEIGTHHRISGRYLHAYANEMAWREDHRRRPNGTLYLLAAGAALGHPVSRGVEGVLATLTGALPTCSTNRRFSGPEGNTAPRYGAVSQRGCSSVG